MEDLLLSASPESRARFILEVFEQCSLAEQLNLLSRLTQCLKRDFLVSLPLETSERILSYLNPTFVVRTCMLVRIFFFRVAF